MEAKFLQDRYSGTFDKKDLEQDSQGRDDYAHQKNLGQKMLGFGVAIFAEIEIKPY